MNSTSTPLLNTGPSMIGPPLVGIILNWWLYGILLMQYYLYLDNPRKDDKFIRTIVHFLFVVDTVQTFLTMGDAFHWFVYNFGDYSKLYTFGFAAIDSPFLDALIALIVQFVYCWRVWVLGRWRIVPVIAGFLSLVACVNGMFLGIVDAMNGSILAFKPAFSISVYLWSLSSAVTDIMIATSMAYLLLKFKSQDTSRNMSSIIKRILLLTLETNAVTAAAAVALSIIFLVQPIAPPRTNVYLTIGYLLGKLYSNCFMVLLNQRLSSEACSRIHTATEEIGTYNGGSLCHRHTAGLKRSNTNYNTHGSGQNHNFESDTSIFKSSSPGSCRRTGSLDESVIIKMSDLGRERSSSSKEGFSDFV